MKTLKYLLSIGIAAGAGLAIGVLTAPENGRKTRKRILREIDETKRAIEDTANKKIKEAKEMLNNSIKAQKSNGKEAISKLKEAVKS